MTDGGQTSAELEAIVALTTEIRGLRRDVREEHRGRRLSVALMAVVVVAAIIVGGLVIRADRIARERDAAVTCATRTDGRRDVRAAIRKAVDVVGVYADIPADERGDLLDRVTVAMLEEIPPPVC